MRRTVLVLALMALLASALSFAATRSECYSSAESGAASLHAHNAKQNPAASPYIMRSGCSGTCAGTYSNCIQQAADAAAICRPDSSGYYTACITANNQADINCANSEIDCCLGEAKRSCDAAYPPDDTAATPSNPARENECYRDYGPNAYYDARTNSCTCPPESTFRNDEIHQCVLNTVFAYCEERNAAYDMKTDSCVCYEGYEPGDGTCVLSDEAGRGGGSLGQAPSGGASGTGSRSGGESGCSSGAILLAIAGASALFSRRG